MASVRIGPLAGQVSGSVGDITFSHNRCGAYVRARTPCKLHGTDPWVQAKNRFSSQSAAWATLSDEERLAWRTYSPNHPITDRLGESRILTGQQLFTGINSRLDLSGYSTLTLPPATPTPSALSSLSVSGNLSGNLSELIFTPSPLSATQVLWMSGCLLSSPAVNYVKDRILFIDVSPTEAASPYDWGAQALDRLGLPVIGQYLVAWISVFDTTSGLLSAPLTAKVVLT